MLTFPGLFFQKLKSAEKEKLLTKALQRALGENCARNYRISLFNAQKKTTTEHDIDISAFLQDVIYGRQDEVNAKLQKDSRLLLESGSVIDPSGREALSVSAYQCAVKCLDTSMTKMLQSHITPYAQSKGMDKKAVAKQLYDQQNQAFIYEFHRVKIIPTSFLEVYKNRAIERNEIVFSYDKENPLVPIQLGYCVRNKEKSTFETLKVLDSEIIEVIKEYVNLTRTEEIIPVLNGADLKKIKRYLSSLDKIPQFDSSVGCDALELLIQEIQAFIRYNTRVRDSKTYCKKTIGLRQCELPANILQELCRQDGQPFSSLAYGIPLPRTCEYHSNSGDLKPLLPFTHDRESGLGVSFALFRFPEHKYASDDACPGNVRSRPQNIELIRLKKDLEWYLRLQEERQQEIQLLTNNLVKMFNELADNSESQPAPRCF